MARKTYEVPFPLLSDPEARVLAAYKVVNQLDDKAAKWLIDKNLDIERFSGQTHHKLAIPSMFLISEDRKVVWAHADRNHRQRPPVVAVLDAIKGVKQ